MAEFKYAICNETFQQVSVEESFALAKRYGYTGVEVAPFTLANDCRSVDRATRLAVRAAAEQLELEVVGLHWLLAKTEGFYLTSPEASVREATRDYLIALAELCFDLGGTVMVLGSPQQRNLLPGVSYDEAEGYAAEVLRGVMPTLERLGIVLAVEPLGPQEGDFMLTADQGRALIERVGSSQCRLHLDVKAMSSESIAIPEIIRANADILEHFHANDANRRGPGMGEIDFVPILRALDDIDYDGWVSVEVFDYEPGPDALAGGSLAYLRNCAPR